MQTERFKLETKIAQLTAVLNKKIEADNKAFARLPRNKKRVAIAQDVLAGLKAGTLLATRGTYVRSKTKRSGETVCNVCAIGSMFAVCSIRDGEKLQDTSESYDSDSDHMRSVLSQYFTSDELEVIEGAFERWGAEQDLGSGQLGDSTKKYTKGLNAEKALEKIMKNIIANGGDFILES